MQFIRAGSPADLQRERDLGAAHPVDNGSGRDPLALLLSAEYRPELSTGGGALLPAAAITLLAVPVYGNEASALCLMGFFLRRLAYGYLFAESGSILLVIVSHWVTTLFYLVLLVGI